MPSVQRHLQKIAANAGIALGLLLLVALSFGDSAVAQRRAAAPAAPACFDGCAAQCRATGNSGASCSRTCYARCSGVQGDTENRF
jgi:hypothetical protein